MATKNKFPVGSSVRFLGYKDEVPEEERMLEEGAVYEVVETTPADQSLAVQVPNPDFNPKKKESEDNSKEILVDVFFDEVEAVDDAAEEEAPAPKAKATTKPATKTAAKTKAAAAQDDGDGDADGDGDEEEEEEEAPAPKAKPAAKATTKPAAKATTKPAAKTAAKPAAKTKAKAPAKEKPAEEEVPVLENEDEDILALVDGADVLELAAELVEDSAALDYRLGGVLYHVRLSGAYKELDDKYAENGGFGLYVKERLNIEYRKAMYLIDIYYKFNLFGIDAAKVQELGWTKCSKIAAVMTDDNAEELVELAEGSSVSELSDAIKESYSTQGVEKSAGEKRKKVAFKFRLWDDQADGVRQVLEQTQSEMGHKDISDTFEHIIMEWATEHDVTVVQKKQAKTTAKATTKAPAAKAPATRRATTKA